MASMDAGAPGWAQRFAAEVNAEMEDLRRRRGPVRLPGYAKADLPAAGANPNCFIYVTDAAGGAVPAFSDGAAWRRVTDRTVIS
ncbi:hypothetical protein [Arenibaculum pallidiluteum]|uniref:hypothetical protein n=1 Tax=Arenibaculum pallidiluteum TaxID=2812559 RepID=UPI001A9600DB|nr:hypothetical protein [Arenibaculum pallidiluteum]